MRIRQGLSCFILLFSIPLTTPAVAQLFTDDIARELARENESQIESIKSLLRELNQNLEKVRQQSTLLTQKNQALEENLRSIGGMIEELQQQLSAAGSKKSEEAYVVRLKQEKQLNELQAQLTTVAAELTNLKKNIAEISGFVSLPPEEKIYASAYAEYQSNNLLQAVDGFNRVLKYYPFGQFSANSLYWLGQAHLALQNYAAAQENADHLLANHADSERAPAAMLIKAKALQGLEMHEEAQQQLRTLIERFPISLAADSARQLLAQ